METRKITYFDIENEYKPSTLTDDNDYINTIKKIVMNLPITERRIFILYTDSGSYSEVARQMKCSSPTVKKYVNDIKQKIMNELNNRTE